MNMIKNMNLYTVCEYILCMFMYIYWYMYLHMNMRVNMNKNMNMNMTMYKISYIPPFSPASPSLLHHFTNSPLHLFTSSPLRHNAILPPDYFTTSPLHTFTTYPLPPSPLPSFTPSTLRAF
jgi:hypothetical protein